MEPRTLSPRAWLNRLVHCYPRQAARLGLPALLNESDDQLLLKELSARASLYDEWLGHGCATLAHTSDVKVSRTLLGSLKKYREPVTGVSEDALRSEAIDRFKRNNRDARQNRIPRRFHAAMREFLSSQLAGFDSSERLCGCPRFGGGAVEEGVSVVGRWLRATALPFDFRDPLRIPMGADTHTVMPCACRLHAVPKDWNKLRLITIEPGAASYLQQTVRSELLLSLCDSRFGDLRALGTCEHFGGSDPQLRHRRMALAGSVDGSLATLDLSDASDLISWTQVCEVFPPLVLAQLERARSTSWYHRGISSDEGEMHMYAGMGNATTFIVETLMFHAACHAIARYHRVSNPRISVFGDDIVCSSELATMIVDLGLFDEFGWRLNRQKSFYTRESRFRESCGVQAFKGCDVTVLRYMGGFDEPAGASALCSFVKRTEELGFSELLWSFPSGWPECVGIPNLGSEAEGGIFTSVPYWETADSSCQWRYNPHYQRREVKLVHLETRRRQLSVRASGHQALGLVYGALSGQLKYKSAPCVGRGFTSRLTVDSPDVVNRKARWTALVG